MVQSVMLLSNNPPILYSAGLPLLSDSEVTPAGIHPSSNMPSSSGSLEGLKPIMATKGPPSWGATHTDLRSKFLDADSVFGLWKESSVLYLDEIHKKWKEHANLKSPGLYVGNNSTHWAISSLCIAVFNLFVHGGWNIWAVHCLTF